MREVFICDAARTAIGRYAGSLAKLRTDDLAAAPIRALVARNPQADWTQLDEVYSRLRQSGRRRQPQCGAHGAPAGRIAGNRSGYHSQQAVRVRAQCGGRCGARDQDRRYGFRHCRRGRIDDARPHGDGQGRRGVLAQRGDLRHHHRLALHQSADEGPIRRRFDAGDRRKRRGRVSGRAQGSGCVRASLAAARRQGRRRRIFCRGNRAGRGAGRQSRSDRGRQG